MKFSRCILSLSAATTTLALQGPATSWLSPSFLTTSTTSISSPAHTGAIPATSSPETPTIQIGNYIPTATVPTHFNQPTGYVHFDCDTHGHQASDHLRSTLRHLHDDEHRNVSGSPAARAAHVARGATPININLYMHIILTNTNKNMITQQMVTDQAAALNEAYNPLGITFLLKSSDFTVHDAWSISASDDADLDMKKALRNGSYADLNLYLHSDLAGAALGKCTLPMQLPLRATAETYIVDGCSVAAGTMPGGPIASYNLGMTAVHETGHWLGLLHTFDGYTCSGPGDYISDTPAESTSTNGCPTSPLKNSCAGREGVDPIHNFMDYSTDACYVRFTDGQSARIRTLWNQYRAGN